MLCFGERGPSPMIGGKRRRGCRSLRHSIHKGGKHKVEGCSLDGQVMGRDGRSQSVDLEIHTKQVTGTKKATRNKIKRQEGYLYPLIVGIVDCGD